MAITISAFTAGHGLPSFLTRRSSTCCRQHWITSATSSTRQNMGDTASRTSRIGKVSFHYPPRNFNTTNASPRGQTPPSSNNFYKPIPQNAETNPRVPVRETKSKVSGKEDHKHDLFIAQFQELIQSKRKTIEQAKKKRAYKPYSELWAESFYHLKGKHTRATCFSQDQLPTLLKTIVSSHCRRDFVLYKDIPTMVVISDFVQNFGIKEMPEAEHLEYEPIPLSHEDPLPNEYKSVLLEEDETLPRGYHTVLDSSFVRIFSHVSTRELFQSWKLDSRERERQVRAIYRRNRWPFTEKVE